ncbi:pyruvate kinase [Algiphilus aromaticivorans]|uniref:pyruvate kinase n=1 Tax=Algiphilus aromaticivorans TaxID=382454 RepID=UPI0005C2346B|nr:pyruvate kinase [Algiphilus aromaticivorans]
MHETHRRRTRILATLGPATDELETLAALVAAGVDAVRINYSHGNHADHARRIRQVREAATAAGRDIGILADLQGPKIRIERFAEGPITLVPGARFALDTAHPAAAGTVEIVGCAYPDLPNDVVAGDALMLNDGAIRLRVTQVAGTRIDTEVEIGGELSDRKGINKAGGGLSAAALTERDHDDLAHAAAQGVDFVAVSFPRNGEDMREARRLLDAAGSSAALVAKIERAEALLALDSIIEASDAVMIARGDLGVEIGDAELPGWQKRITRAAREDNRLVITATQMMESMITSPIPTRAEVLDVANAVMDGTDAVMLSAETATGRHPPRVVEAMARVCLGAEAAMPEPRGRDRMDSHFVRTDEAIAMATIWTAQHMHAQAIVALTESGSTALMMSRSDTRIPIFALTQLEATRRRMTLCRGVYPIAFTPSELDSARPAQEATDMLLAHGWLQRGDRALLTKGDFTGPGGTNTMKIVTVDG